MKGRVLVIDDEESIVFTFERFLRDAGYEVRTARDFREALASIAENDFDVIFTDIILGGKTGIDILQGIRERNLTCPVVLITGYPSIETAAEALRLGAFDYIPKPLNKEALLRVTNVAFQYKKAIDEKEQYRSNIEAIFRSVRDAIITVDKEMRVVEVNEAAKSVCGVSREEVGKDFASLGLGCKQACFESLKDTIEKGQPVERHRFECGRLNRHSQVVTVITHPLLDAQNRFSGTVMVVRDETRLATLERDLAERRQFSGIVGKSKEMQKIYSLVEDLANVQTTVLITGESGTGKELVARALHDRGSRSDKPLVKVNCSALSENLLESEFFGHVKGAFTGAINDRIGRFQLADGGTIFLDEVGDISLGTQQRLLRVLQEREFERVGDSTPVKVDVRVIAATNKDLRDKVKGGEFREDLYYRLKVVEIDLPPLRERQEDIPLLVDHFIKKFNRKFSREIEAVSEDVLRIFMNCSWSGNVRELEHVIEHAFILCRQDTIALDHLPRDFEGFAEDDESVSLQDGTVDEWQAILQALEKTSWNKARAARLLGISTRTMFRKIKEYKIIRDAHRDEP